MERIKNILLICTFAAATSCSGTDGGQNDSASRIPVNGFVTEIGSLEDVDAGARAVSEFAVNGPLDPTNSAADRTAWELSVTAYYNGTPAADGSSACTWVGDMWVPDDPMFLPNYLNQQIGAELKPQGWTEVSETQNTAPLLLGQDVLTQNGTNTTTVTPAHVITVPMRHSHSMIDFIIAEADETDILTVEVEIDGVTWRPYRVGTQKIEYMLIVPVGTSTPIVRIETVGGARYSQDIPVTGSEINRCYCIKFIGLELKMAVVTVADWTTGRATAAEYSTITSYPTFKGPPDTWCIIEYDNGLTQRIEFNDRGESTVKPDGRTIVRIMNDLVDQNFVPPLVIRGMQIDLTNYLIIPE